VKTTARTSFHRTRRTEDEADYYNRVFWEFTMAASLEHKNVIHTFSLHFKSDLPHQVMEYCPKGCLYDIVRNKTPAQETVQTWTKQLLAGVHYLHEQGMAHRDIKTANILLAEDGLIKIIDFGLAVIVHGVHPGISKESGLELATPRCKPSRAGTLRYLSPEVYDQEV
jgi:protein-serine/threonine kinase